MNAEPVKPQRDFTPGSSFIITMTESSGAIAGVGSFTVRPDRSERWS
jgi:hypothetical protein